MKKKFSNKLAYRHARLSVIALFLAICFMLPFQPVLALNAAAPTSTEAQSTEASNPNAILLGDYDGDGKINVQDAILTLRAAMGLITPSEQSLITADMDGDRALTVKDAIIILRIAMGLIEPPAPPSSTEPIKILFIGAELIGRADSMYACHDSRLFFKSMCEDAGIQISYESMIRSFYTIYENGLTGKNQTKVQEMLNSDPEHPFDYVVVQISRDRALSRENSANNEKIALQNIENYLKESNSEGKMVLLVPTYRNNLHINYWNEFIRKFDWSTTKDQSDAIRAHVQELADSLKESPIIADVLTAFDEMLKRDIKVFDDEEIDFSSIDGSFVTAATIFEAIFERSAYGLGSAAVTTEAGRELVISEHLARLYGIEPAKPVEHWVSKMDWSHENITDEIIALQAVAKAFYDRREWLQYDTLFRERVHMSAHRPNKYILPEDATEQNSVFTDCAYFPLACYLNTFNQILPKIWTGSTWLSVCQEYGVRPYLWTPSSEPDKEKAEQEFLAALKPGDVIVYLEKGGGGHVMLYLGSGIVAHSTGVGICNYDYNNMCDNYEPAGTVRYTTIDELVNEKTASYLFTDNKEQVGLCRPLDVDLKAHNLASHSEWLVTDRTKARLANLQNIVVSKTTSHPEGITANPGDPVTFTISVKNNNMTTKNVTITDSVPEGMTGEDVNTTIYIFPGKTRKISYTFYVGEETACNTIIHCQNTKVNGVQINDCPVYVMQTLNEEQRHAFTEAALGIENAEDGLDLAKKAYNEVFEFGLPIDDVSKILWKVFYRDQDNYPGCVIPRYTPGHPIRNMLVEPVYGGQCVRSNTLPTKTARIFDPSSENMMAGDLLVMFQGEKGNLTPDTWIVKIFICLENGQILGVTDGKPVLYDTPLHIYANVTTSLLGQRAFCLLRPSAIMP